MGMLDETLQDEFNRSNRTQRRHILHPKDRTFTRRGYAFGNKIGGKTLAIAEHFYKKENPNARAHN